MSDNNTIFLSQCLEYVAGNVSRAVSDANQRFNGVLADQKKEYDDIKSSNDTTFKLSMALLTLYAVSVGANYYMLRELRSRRGRVVPVVDAVVEEGAQDHQVEQNQGAPGPNPAFLPDEVDLGAPANPVAEAGRASAGVGEGEQGGPDAPSDFTAERLASQEKLAGSGFWTH